MSYEFFNRNDIMNRNDILRSIRMLAQSQGFYGRLYDLLTNGSDESKQILDTMESQNFKDTVDMVMWIECD